MPDPAALLALAAAELFHGDVASATEHTRAALAALAALEGRETAPRTSLLDDEDGEECALCARGELVSGTVIICRGAGDFSCPCPAFLARVSA